MPSVTERLGIRLTRVFDAPRERLWREWTEPERFADWFGGPDSQVPVSSVSMDVRPGGTWRATMFAGPERREIAWEGEYLEVEPPERLVMTFSDQPGDDSFEHVTVVFTALGDGRTEMLLEQRGPRPPAAYDRTREGWGIFFDRIDKRLAEAP